MYEHIYQNFCKRSLKICCEKIPSIEHQNQCIKESFIDIFSDMRTFRKKVTYIHKANMSELDIPWNKIFSNGTCMCCLRRKPENVFTCGHAVCDICVRIFGKRLPNKKFHYKLEHCLLCFSGSLEITLKPPTAGVRILSIDGGGSRGVVPLEFLKILQNMIGQNCPVQNLFDLAFGTSSGIILLKRMNDTTS